MNTFFEEQMEDSLRKGLPEKLDAQTLQLLFHKLGGSWFSLKVAEEVLANTGADKEDFLSWLLDRPRETALTSLVQEATVADLFSKGFSLRQLMGFVHQYVHSEQKIDINTTTAEVVSKIIIPQTAKDVCCYADALPGGPQTPQTLMSHWWGNTFLNLVVAICQHAGGKSQLFEHCYTKEELDKTYWLCIFAVNQHVSICRDCPCGAEKYPAGHPRCQMDKFAQVMERMKTHALALDPKLRTLTRVWVLDELNMAINHVLDKPGLDTVFYGADIDEKILLCPEGSIPSVEDAEASYPEDKVLILGRIKGSEIGLAGFDKAAKSKAMSELARVRSFLCAARGGTADVAQLLKDLREYPLLLDAFDVQGGGESLLQVAARNGRLQVVEDLLSLGAKVNVQNRIGWTALHFACICQDAQVARKQVDLLIHARADVEARNHFDRTPAEEAHFFDPSLAKFLCQSYGCTVRTDFDDFHPLPSDESLFSHQVTRLDSRRILFLLPKDGEVQVCSDWVMPVRFGQLGERSIPLGSHERIDQIIQAGLRIAAYLRHSWPMWNFDRLLIRYSNDDQPRGYRIHLNAQSFQQVDVQDSWFAFKTASVGINNGIRQLYP